MELCSTSFTYLDFRSSSCSLSECSVVSSVSSLEATVIGIVVASVTLDFPVVVDSVVEDGFEEIFLLVVGLVIVVVGTVAVLIVEIMVGSAVVVSSSWTGVVVNVPEVEEV